MTHKWFSILSVGVLAMGLVACSNSGNNNNDSKDNNTHNETTINEETEQTSDDEQENKKNNTNDIDQSHNETPNDNNQENSENQNNTNTTDNHEQLPNSDEDPTITALVNKQYSLDETYAPNDLVTVDVPTVLENPEINQLREVAADALKSMFDQAKEAGIHLYARSGYRSYQTQVQLFQNYLEKHGEAAANRYSAKPGQSEHQTGLVMDVTSESVNYQLNDSFDETKEGKWLQKHAHEFGFIIRYPKDAEDITGYIYEPWHIRYLGVEMATDVYDSGLTYEEYLQKEGIIHEKKPSQ